MTEAQKEFIEASRAQRAAYFAWQNAPAGCSEAAIAAYNEACKRQRDIEQKIKNNT